MIRLVQTEAVLNRCSGDIITPTHRPFENNLHHIVQDLLKREYDFWISFDPDNPPINNPIDLIALDKDIIGCPTPVWHNAKPGTPGERPYMWNAWDYVPDADAYKEHAIKKGLQKVDAVGTGCIVMARRVFEDPRMQTGCFARSYHADGTVEKGNDIRFCERARACGFEVYAHYDYMCMHFNEIELGEVIAAFDSLYSKEDTHV